MTVGFYTLGCKLNQCETEALASGIRSKGFSIIEGEGLADVYIVNTCAVTAKSEQKARRKIRIFAATRCESLVVVTGCYAQVAKDELASMSGNIVVVPQEEKSRLFDAFASASELLPVADVRELSGFIKNALSSHARRIEDRFAFNTDDYNFHSRAFLKIQDGCDAACAYCIVPLARGRAISLEPDKVLESVAQLEQKGYREIVITGVNISAYDYGGFGFASLLEKICESLTHARIRLSSIEPESVDERLARVLSHRAICPHFHIPVQSGSDAILGAMKRRYDSARLEEAVRVLKDAKPGCFLGCDVIVGFPGETDEDFAKTRELVTRLGFSALHVFRFSARPGTAAYSMPGKVSEGIGRSRARELIALSGKLLSAYIESKKGTEAEAVLQQKPEPGVPWPGLTENYLKVLVHGLPENEAKRGSLVRIRIGKTDTISDASFIAFI